MTSALARLILKLVSKKGGMKQLGNLAKSMKTKPTPSSLVKDAKAKLNPPKTKKLNAYQKEELKRNDLLKPTLKNVRANERKMVKSGFGDRLKGVYTRVQRDDVFRSSRDTRMKTLKRERLAKEKDLMGLSERIKRLNKKVKQSRR
tara:strand:- start:4531 stop:4968 length:438 start_codon:yes stop_codon:yes gene_type:complete